jgi:hypothetical protein
MKRSRSNESDDNSGTHTQARPSLSTMSSSSRLSGLSRWQQQLPVVISDIIRNMLLGREILFIFERVCHSWYGTPTYHDGNRQHYQPYSWLSLHFDEWADHAIIIETRVTLHQMRVIQRLLHPRLPSLSLQSLSIDCATKYSDFNAVVEQWPRLRHLQVRYRLPEDTDSDDDDAAFSLTPLSLLISLTSLDVRVDDGMTFDWLSNQLHHLVHLQINTACNNIDIEPIKWSLPLLQSLVLVDASHTSLLLPEPDKTDGHDIDGENEKGSVASSWPWCSKHLKQLDINIAMTYNHWCYLLEVSSSIESLTLPTRNRIKHCSQLLSLIHQQLPISLQSLSLRLPSNINTEVGCATITLVSCMISLKHLMFIISGYSARTVTTIGSLPFEQLATLTRLLSLDCLPTSLRKEGDPYAREWPFTKLPPLLPRTQVNLL